MKISNIFKFYNDDAAPKMYVFVVFCYFFIIFSILVLTLTDSVFGYGYSYIADIFTGLSFMLVGVLLVALYLSVLNTLLVKESLKLAIMIGSVIPVGILVLIAPMAIQSFTSRVTPEVAIGTAIYGSLLLAVGIPTIVAFIFGIFVRFILKKTSGVKTLVFLGIPVIIFGFLLINFIFTYSNESDNGSALEVSHDFARTLQSNPFAMVEVHDLPIDTWKAVRSPSQVLKDDYHPPVVGEKIVYNGKTYQAIKLEGTSVAFQHVDIPQNAEALRIKLLKSELAKNDLNADSSKEYEWLTVHLESELLLSYSIYYISSINDLSDNKLDLIVALPEGVQDGRLFITLNSPEEQDSVVYVYGVSFMGH